VFLNLQAARIGALNIEHFKRHVKYCLLPNGTCTDKVLQSKGRHSETKIFIGWERMAYGLKILLFQSSSMNTLCKVTMAKLDY
jgi:hypothetical protein